ncbi:tyrosine-type recombinase/integrase [Duganella sp. CY42W]|uniref:Tyrosine-type recombinase/integrase n=1 Tax=Duganella levis TaxID=2692169 RepID=A0ABW9VTA1_9BURK|nr:tyrosine-type recombinase/integrase [Duganella levis]
MKRRNPHHVYLSSQALEILLALKICAGGLDLIFPSRYDPDQPISHLTLNRIVYAVEEQAWTHDRQLAPFTDQDLRRTKSTLLHDAGFNSDWIEKCLAHKQRGVRSVYSKAEYAVQRCDMLQK